MNPGIYLIIDDLCDSHTQCDWNFTPYAIAHTCNIHDKQEAHTSVHPMAEDMILCHSTGGWASAFKDSVDNTVQPIGWQAYL